MTKSWTQEQNEAYESCVSGKYMPAMDWIHKLVSAWVEPMHAKRVMVSFCIDRDGRSMQEREFCQRSALVQRKREAQLRQRHAAALAIVEAAPGYDGAPC
jgi:hypothetical protein